MAARCDPGLPHKCLQPLSHTTVASPNFILDPLRRRIDNSTTMAKFRIEQLAELARQMQFTPHDTRLAQVNAAEDLLHSVDVNKAYPPAFIIFRITGYHPRGHAEELLAGPALQHDLGLLIEQVSQTLDLHTAVLREPVL